MKKRVLLLSIMLVLIPLLVGCNNYREAGFIKWAYNDLILDWKDVKEADYYQIVIYQDDLVTPADLFGEALYAYDSNFSFADYRDDNFNLKIIAVYSDGTEEESEIIQFEVNREFQQPVSWGGNYFGDMLSWSNLSEDNLDFVNYTIKINDEEIEVNENQYYIGDYEPGIYKYQVRANYTEGSSLWSRAIYLGLDIGVETKNLIYDISTNEDFIYSFDESEKVVAVIGDYNLFSNYILSNDVAKIDRSTLTMNQFYIRCEYSILQSENPKLIRFRVVTEEKIYDLYITCEIIT